MAATIGRIALISRSCFVPKIFARIASTIMCGVLLQFTSEQGSRREKTCFSEIWMWLKAQGVQLNFGFPGSGYGLILPGGTVTYA